MKALNTRDYMTDREREEYKQEKEVAQLQADYQLKYKEMESEIKYLETKWTQVFRLPFAIITLPVRFLFGLGYIAHTIKGSKPDDRFWEYLNKL